jgi:hypothetical protein
MPEISYDAPRPQTMESEEEIYSKLINPEGRTSYKKVMEFDFNKNKFVEKAVDLGSPELNLSDLTTAILVGQKSEFAFAWHTTALINQLVFIMQEDPKYDLSNLIRFHYNNLTTNLNLSKSVDGALMKAITTKELKQIQEHRMVGANGEAQDEYKGLGDFLRRGLSAKK